MPLPRYFVERSLQKIRPHLSPAQQTSIDTLIKRLDGDGRVNFNGLREALLPLAAVKSGNAMLGRFLKRIDEAAAELGMVFSCQTTPDKRAGDNRWIWFEGLAEAAVKPHSGDLNSIPPALLQDDQRGMVLGAPVVLITFNEHETRAVQAAFSVGPDRYEGDGGRTFARLGLVGDQPVIHVISRQSRKEAQDTATWIIQRFRPTALIATGIALGVNNGKRRIGDVLVTDYFFDYENARLNGDGSVTYRGPRPSASRSLVDRIRALDQLHGDHANWPKLHIGCTACGDKLVDNADFIRELLKVEPELIGGEMEIAGIEAAARDRKTDWALVKGISDWGDGTKNTNSKDADQRMAADNAITVVKALLDQGPVLPVPDMLPRLVPAQPPSAAVAARSHRPPPAAIMGLGDLCGVAQGAINCAAAGRPARLDALRKEGDATSAPAEGEAAGSPVLPHLRAWLADPDSPPLFALLGEYGMGKTITCQLLAQQLDEARAQDPTQPIPLYFDLRHITGLRERVPDLKGALEECMSRGWLDSGGGDGYTLASVHQWIAQGAVIIFDGLDEVLVKLTEADGRVFTDNLLKLIADTRARAKAEGRAASLKVLITCRTQYFPTLQAQNSHFTQADRGEFSADRYQAMVLLPWTEAQVRHYLAQALPGTDVEALIEMVRSVHNLEELTQRPYTLKLVAEFIPSIEQDRAAGRPVYGATLYRRMAEKWLTRDSGKHHIHPDHKLRLAAHLAAHLWRSGRNALPVEELNDWFHAWIDTDSSLRSRYLRLHPEQLEEDLRTATFLARQDEGERSAFRFAHTSLLEFFLARYMVDAISRDDRHAWAMPIPSRETLDFLGQLLGEAANPALLATLQRWARDYLAQASEVLLAYGLRTRDARLPAISLRGMDLRGARLRSWVLAGQPGALIDLTGARFDGADLRDAVFRHGLLDTASYVSAQLDRANLLDCRLEGADFSGAAITACIFRNSRLAGSRWDGARGYRPQWIDCDGEVGWRAQGHVIDAVTAPADVAIQNAALEWLDGHRGWVLSCAFAPGVDAAGRQWLASGGLDGTLRLWDAASGEAGPVLRGHEGWVWSCAFAPGVDAAGRQWLASGGEDGTLRLWDAASGEAGPVLRGHEGWVWSCAFAPGVDAAGRQWLASGGRDGTLRLWDAASGDCLRVTALCKGSADGRVLPGYATWEPATHRVIDVSGEAWRYLAWMRARPDALPERLPLETFGPVPFKP